MKELETVGGGEIPGGGGLDKGPSWAVALGIIIIITVIPPKLSQRDVGMPQLFS